MEGDLKRRPEEGIGTAVVDLAVAGLFEAVNLVSFVTQEARGLARIAMGAFDSLPPIRPNGNNGNNKPDGNSHV